MDPADSDFLQTDPRFTEQNFQQDLVSAEEIPLNRRGDRVHASRGLVDLAACTGRRHRSNPRQLAGVPVEENVATDEIQLSPDQLDRLNNITAAAGGHYSEEQIWLIERWLRWKGAEGVDPCSPIRWRASGILDRIWKELHLAFP